MAASSSSMNGSPGSRSARRREVSALRLAGKTALITGAAGGSARRSPEGFGRKAPLCLCPT